MLRARQLYLLLLQPCGVFLYDLCWAGRGVCDAALYAALAAVCSLAEPSYSWVCFPLRSCQLLLLMIGLYSSSSSMFGRERALLSSKRLG